MPYPVSANFKKRIKYRHNKSTVARILTPEGPSSTVLNVTEGSVTEDATNDIQGQCDLTLVDPKGALIPEDANALLYPGVNEIQIEQTVTFPDLTSEVVQLDIFSYPDIDIHATGESLTIGIEGFDRSKRISEAVFLDVWSVASGANVADEIKRIILNRAPKTTFLFDTTTVTVSAKIFDRGADPWKAAQELAASAGMALYFNRLGECVLKAISSLVSSVDWEYIEGAEATILEINKQLSRAEYNHVVEIGEGGEITTPFSAEAKDQWSIDNTGDRTIFHVSSLYTNVSQCQTAANAKLENVRGTTENINVQTIPNPAVTPRDVASVTNTLTKVNGVYIIDRVSTPLTAVRGQYLKTRKRVIGA